MKARTRRLEFDFLERLALLSGVHAAVAHHAHGGPHSASTQPPAFVLDVEALAATIPGSHVSEQTIVAPGSSVDYRINVTVDGHTVTVANIQVTDPDLRPIEPG